MKSKNHILFLLLAAFIIISVPALAQCPMCRASAETSIKEGSRHALGLNSGILYLLAFPYLIATTLFLLWYRHYRKGKAASARS